MISNFLTNHGESDSIENDMIHLRVGIHYGHYGRIIKMVNIRSKKKSLICTIRTVQFYTYLTDD